MLSFVLSVPLIIQVHIQMLYFCQNGSSFTYSFPVETVLKFPPLWIAKTKNSQIQLQMVDDPSASGYSSLKPIFALCFCFGT